MPFSDPERSRDYFREYRRLRRAGDSRSTPCSTLPAEFRLETASDVIGLMEAQVQAVLDEEDLGVIERARIVGYLATISLRAIEAGNLTLRIEALEAAAQRKTP